MFFTNALKDYIEQVNNLFILFDGNISFFVIIKSTFLYVLDSFVLVGWYFISFQWLTDFVELPAMYKHHYSAILENRSVLETDLYMILGRDFFSFLNKSHLNSNNFATGFLNSLFLAIPCSVPQILSLRALIINGVPAGISSALGTIFGQILFFGCILFGFESLLVPFLSFEPLTILAGSIILMNILYNMTHSPNFAILNLSRKTELMNLFRTNFLLAWLEQICVYSYFGNLTVNGSSNLLATGDVHPWFLLTTFFYLLGLLIGSLMWTCLFGFLLLNLRNYCSRFAPNLPFLAFNERFHPIFLCATIILSFSNIPYYGIDYVFYNPLGFVPEDQSIPSPKVFYEPEQLIDLDPLGMDFIEDLTPFDESYSPPTLGFKYEHGNLDSEYNWQNRLQLRPAVAEAAHRQLYDTKPISLLDFKVPPYAHPDLTLQANPTKHRAPAAVNLLDTLSKQVFRPDVYVRYRDPSSDIFGPSVQTHRQFREKYYTNPIYKAIVNFDLYPFLMGQSPAQNLSEKEEYDLFTKRIILQNYLTTVRDYKTKRLKNNEMYADRVYNQQFKGSLNLVRQFNAVELSLDAQDDPAMYTEEDKTDPFLHWPYEIKNIPITKKVLKFDQPLYKSFSNEKTALYHEELPRENFRPYQTTLLTDTSPFYIGWDSLLRKFLVKTSSLAMVEEPRDQETSQSKESKERKPKKNRWYKRFNQKKKLTFEATPREDLAKEADIPYYFEFQAWSPALDRSFHPDTMKLPCLTLNEKENHKLQIALELKEEETSSNYGIDQTGKKFAGVVTQKAKDLLFSTLPNYNWDWKKAEMDDNKKDQYIDLGNAPPPQLDGLAWPGSKNPTLLQKLIKNRDAK
jgi:hypothetical protein